MTPLVLPISIVSETCHCCQLCSKQPPYKKLPFWSLVILRSNLSISNSFCIRTPHILSIPCFPVSLCLGLNIQGHSLLSPSLPEAACLQVAMCGMCSRSSCFWWTISWLSWLSTCGDSVFISSSGWFSCLFSNLTQNGFIYGAKDTNAPFTLMSSVELKSPDLRWGQSALSTLLCLLFLGSLAELVSGLPASSWECWTVFLKTDCTCWL